MREGLGRGEEWGKDDGIGWMVERAEGEGREGVEGEEKRIRQSYPIVQVICIREIC